MSQVIPIRPTASAVAEALISESLRDVEAARAGAPTYMLAIDVALAVCADRDIPGMDSSEPGPLSWERMLEIGTASAEAGRRSDARRAYLIAFDLAHAMGSVRGILLVAATLGALGDETLAVASMLRVARRLSAGPRRD